MKHLLIALALLCATALSAQTFKHSEPQKAKFKRDYTFGMLGKFGSDIIGYYRVKGDMHIQRMNAEGKLVKESAFEISQYGDKLDYLGAVQKDDNTFFLIGTFLNAKTSTFYFYKREIDAKSLMPTGELELLAEIKTNEDRRSYRSVGMIDDEKGKTSGLYYFSGQDEVDGLGVYIPLDENIEAGEQQEFSVEIKPGESYGTIDNVLSDSQGNVYLLASFVRKKVADRPVLVKLNSAGEKEYEFSLPLERVFIVSHSGNSYFLGLNEAETDLYVAAFTSEEGRKGATGALIQKVDAKEGKLANSENLNFSEEFINDYIDSVTRREKKAERKKDKNIEDKPGIPHLQGINLLTYDDGSMAFVGEQDWVVITTTTDSNGRTTTRERYYNGSVVVMRFDQDLNLIHNSMVQRYAVSSSPQDLINRACVFAAGNDTHVLYNARAGDLEGKNYFVWNCNNALGFATINAAGEKEVKALIEGSGEQTYVVTGAYVEIEPGRYGYPVVAKKMFAMGLIDLEK